jgi:hypothetical protein
LTTGTNEITTDVASTALSPGGGDIISERRGAIISETRGGFIGIGNAIISPWSNGQTEGQITRLKLIKRQMYGRAKLDLLRARVVGV